MRPRARRWAQRGLERVERFRKDALTIRSGDPLAARFAAFGTNSRILWPPVDLGNTRSITIGDDVFIRSGVCFEALAAPGTVVIRIGDRVQLGQLVRMVAVNGIEIADGAGIGHGTTLADTIHDYKAKTEEQAPWQANLKLGRPLRIERDVWVGNNCVIAGGLTIGARSIIGPNAVINRDVPPDTLVAGNPAHVQRRRRDDGGWDWLVDPASLELELPEGLPERG